MAAPVNVGRHHAELDGEFVVFLVGARVNRLRALPRMIRVGRQMSAMQAELRAHPELGCLHMENYVGRSTISVQYWRDFDSLERYARSAANEHLPAWREFNRLVRDSGDIGIWHETYLIPAGGHESLYGNMPRVGLAAAGSLVRTDKASTARRRAGRPGATEAPVPAY